MTKKCLMIETIDNRKLFTHEDNFDEVIELSDIFGTEISVVQVKNPEILDLTELAPALCSQENKKPDFEIIERKTVNKKNRNKILKSATLIKDHIKTTLLAREPVKLSDIAKKFSRHNLSLACFCNHFKLVRKELEKDGYKIAKTGQGEYSLV